MDIPVVIHKEDGTVYGVSVPDVVGVHSWGDTIDEAMKNVREAIYSHVAILLELGEEVKLTSSRIEDLSKNPDYANGVWALVDIDLSLIDKKPERINISLPSYLLKRIDTYVAARHETRSGFLARAALNTIAEEAAA